MSAVWSEISRSMLMALEGIVVPVVNRGTSMDLPGPRNVRVPPPIQLTSLMVPASTVRKKRLISSGTQSTATTRAIATKGIFEVIILLTYLENGLSGDE